MFNSLRRLFGTSPPPPQAAAPAPAPSVDWKAKGNAALGRGDLAEAARWYRTGAAQAPGSVVPHLNLGYCLLEMGQHAEAQASLMQARSLAPAGDAAAFEANHLLGRTRQEQGDDAGALAFHREAVQCDPRQALGWRELGRAQHATGDRRSAIESARRALALEPQLAEAINDLTTWLLEERHATEALQWADRLAQIPGTGPVGHLLAATALNQIKRNTEALQRLEQALLMGAFDAGAHQLHGTVLSDLRRHAEAVTAFEQAVQLAPRTASPRILMALALRVLGQQERANQVSNDALALPPESASDSANQAQALHDMGRCEEALAVCDAGLQRWPQDFQLQFNRSLVLLLMGRLQEAWPGYEHRWALIAQTGTEGSSAPLWRGQPLQGKTLYLTREQGLGDGIQQMRFFAGLGGQCERLVVFLHKALVPLTAGMPANCLFVSEGDRLPAHDFQCALMSLPLALDLAIEDIPARVPYLRLPDELTTQWAQRIGPRNRPRIGLVWSGNPLHSNDAHRSLKLDQLLAHLPDTCELFSLQKELRGQDADILARDGRLRHFGDELHTFADTGALATAMDLVISVDTSVAHLAGALGVPLWILIPHNPDWRWMQHRTDTPWYPTARLFRQGADASWPPVLLTVRSALDTWLTGR